MDNNLGNKFGLSDRNMNDFLNYFKQNPFIEKVKIYGSRAKGNFRLASDIDFAVWLTEKGSVSTVYFDLDNLPTPYKFDVTDYNKLTDENIKKSIDSEGILFYQKVTTK